MKRLALFIVAVIATPGLFCIVGCDDTPQPVPTTGTVTVDGKPADGALVRLWPTVLPANEEHIVRPLGTADAQGNFALTTYSAGDGAPVGKYKVTVEWRPPRESTMAPDGPDKLAGQYADPEKSKIEVDVTSPSTQIPAIALEMPAAAPK